MNYIGLLENITTERYSHASSYLIKGRNILYTILMKLLGWTMNNAFKFFLYLKKQV